MSTGANGADAKRAASRGRLNSLDLLPDEAQDDVLWAIGQLNQRERTQSDILFELNDRLEAKGIEGISRSAFNRASMRLSARARRISERQQIYAGIAEQLTPDAVGKTDVILAEFLKTLIDELLDGDKLTPKNAMELASAYRAIIGGQRQSIEMRRELQAEFDKKASKAIDEVAKVRGLTDETTNIMKTRLGIKPRGAEA